LEADAAVFANRKFREANMVKSVGALARASSDSNQSKRRAPAIGQAIESVLKALH
jgi:hypothetical protein